MAATLIVAPRPLTHAGNSNKIKLQTNLGAPSAAKFTLRFFTSGAGTPSAGQSFTLTWGGRSVTFTAANSPNNSGLQIPTYASGDHEAYVRSVVYFLRRNDAITEDFTISIDNTGLGIVLTYRIYGELGMSYAGAALVHIQVTATNGTAVFSQPNLTARVYVVIPTDDDELPLVTLQSPYDPETRQTEFDLRGLFDFLTPELPTNASIAPNSGSALMQGLTTQNHAVAAFRYADRYGASNPTAEGLLRSLDFRVIYGALAADSLNSFPYDDDVFLCHNYRIRGSVDPFWKPVSIDQPDWVYLWSNVDRSVYVKYALWWSDGTANDYTPSGVVGFTTGEKKLRWIQSGFSQCKLALATPPVAGAEIVRYEWQLCDLSTNRVIVSAKYELGCESHPWNLFLAMDNGLGGVETVWMKGKTGWKYNVERTEIDIDEMLGSYLVRGQHVLEASTGWHEAFYIEHLRQLLLGKTWIVDTRNKRFIGVVVDTKSIDVKEDDQELFALTISIKYAAMDAAFNNY